MQFVALKNIKSLEISLSRQLRLEAQAHTIYQTNTMTQTLKFKHMTHVTHISPNLFDSHLSYPCIIFL